MNLNEIAQKAYTVSIKRQKNGAAINIDRILNHCAGEVLEAQEAFTLWKTEEKDAADYAEELADVILCALIASARSGLDINSAVETKLKKIELRADLKGDKL